MGNKNAQTFLDFIDIGDDALKNSIKSKTTQVLCERIELEVNAYIIRNAGFLANKLGQQSTNDLSKFSARVLAQSIAIGHMRGHAVVSSDYAIKVTNILFPKNIVKVEEERNRQLTIGVENAVLIAINSTQNMLKQWY